MPRQWRTRQTPWALAAPLATAALLVTPGTAGARAAGAQAPPCQSWTSTLPPSPGAGDNQFFGVTALSACDVWAVGAYRAVASGPLLSLAEHWNGTAWKVVPTPDPGTSINFLRAVSAFSASNVWAVGHADDSTLTLHWNGTAWKQVPSPSPGTGTTDDLEGVDAVSATSAWAVGEVLDSTSSTTLVLRWNGTKWSQVASPAPGTDSRLDAVTITSASYGWAVGSFVNGTAGKTLILHWNGTKWVQVPSPNPSGPVTEMDLDAAASTSASNAWAVGTYSTATSQQTFIARWNGTAWRQVLSPSPGTEPFLFGVAAASASDAWAVGAYTAGSAGKTLIVRWNGTVWKQEASPSPGTGSSLTGVAATSVSNVWAVGDFSNGGPSQVFAIHCC
jgi:hypothetical protein